MEIVLSLAEKRAVIAEAKKLYDNAMAYIQTSNEGYCFHGTYVGGCGIDWMCGYCESGEQGSSPWDYLEGGFRYSVALSRIKGQIRSSRIEAWVANLSAKGLKGSQIMEIAEKQLSQYEIDLVSTLAWRAFKAEFAH